MKKLTVWILSIILLLGCCLSFSSCRSSISERTGFYTKATLKELHLEGLKKPNYTYKEKDDFVTRTIMGDIEKEEFERYAEEVFEFLTNRYEYVLPIEIGGILMIT